MAFETGIAAAATPADLMKLLLFISTLPAIGISGYFSSAEYSTAGSG
jgi:hypothetical protein